MLPGRSYLLKIGATHGAGAGHRAQAPHRRQHAGASSPPRRWRSTRSASAISRRRRRSPSTPIATITSTGAFILIDRQHQRDGGGRHDRAWPAPRHQRPSARASTVDREAHAALKHQKPAILWFTGLSGAGKSTIANLVEQKLHARGVHTATARRRQCPPRPQQGSRLHRRRPRREHPPRRRGGAADDRRRPDRADARSSRRSAPSGGWRARSRRRASSWRSSSTRRSRLRSRAIPRASTSARSPARSRISPASTSPMKRRRRRSLFSNPAKKRPRRSPIASSRRLNNAGSWRGCREGGSQRQDLVA